MSSNAVSSSPKAPECQESGCDFMKLLKQTFASGELSDVCFAVGRDFGNAQNFPAHKLILSIRSAVFRTMFYGSLPENCDKAISIPDIHPDAFANMLSFVYTEAVENLTSDNVFATMSCADKYDLPQLVRICSDFIGSHLNAETCLATLQQAVSWHADSIVEKCMGVLEANTVAILQSDQFTAISQDTLKSILQSDTLSAKEHAVYLAVERWASAACARNALDALIVARYWVTLCFLYAFRS
ncbi:BTB/POZ domain-containing protein 3-like [Paramacrobiotus metropolitanus]|uniref:BTB/POZ domain-containing protein 3-like n=1 Tax=Paramacrobiotus metropolitanus TaxID=2943436 RepID=UPI0024464F8B|nr:BTB/POZ domain-containing protein 3-like [Paramacrobiotus metropolitanus]XP_055347119.1 BTB/POZ domain-containing protein 3-like [Paramacrobiotus metropolitanus]